MKVAGSALSLKIDHHRYNSDYNRSVGIQNMQSLSDRHAHVHTQTYTQQTGGLETERGGLHTAVAAAAAAIRNVTAVAVVDFVVNVSRATWMNEVEKKQPR